VTAEDRRLVTAIKQPSASRNVNLDILRGVAILLVVLYHMNVPGFSTGGWIGVDLFFVLSGFLISGLLFKEWKSTGVIKIGRFYVRRGLKIYPAFYTLLAITLAVNHFVPGIPTDPVTSRSILSESLFIQNYDSRIWGQSWSLAVEEHFYLILPLLFLVLRKRDPENPFRALPSIFGGIAGIELALRIATTWGMHSIAYEPLYLMPTHLRIDSLFFGVLLGYYYHFEPKKIADNARGNAGLFVMAIAVGLAFMVGMTNPIMHTVEFTLLYLGFGLLLCKVVNANPARWLSPIAWIGYYSYSIYLWHGWALRLLPRDTALEYVVAFVVSLAPGIVMAHLVEMPVLALRNRWFPRSTREAL